MSDVGQIERKIQDHVVQLLVERLDYGYLGNREYREGNSNVEVALLSQNLKARGYSDDLITWALDHLSKPPPSAPATIYTRRTRTSIGSCGTGEGTPGRGTADPNSLADRREEPGCQPLRWGRGNQRPWPSHEAARRRALRERLGAGNAGVEALQGGRLRRHPPNHRQPGIPSSSDPSSRPCRSCLRAPPSKVFATASSTATAMTRRPP